MATLRLRQQRVRRRRQTPPTDTSPKAANLEEVAWALNKETLLIGKVLAILRRAQDSLASVAWMASSQAILG
jgi:hypothetical protein